MPVSINFHQEDMQAEARRQEECSVVWINDGDIHISLFVDDLDHAQHIADALNGAKPEQWKSNWLNELVSQRNQAEYDLGLERQRLEIYKQAMNDIICGGDVGAIADAARIKADEVGQLKALKDK